MLNRKAQLSMGQYLCRAAVSAIALLGAIAITGTVTVILDLDMEHQFVAGRDL